MIDCERCSTHNRPMRNGLSHSVAFRRARSALNRTPRVGAEWIRQERRPPRELAEFFRPAAALQDELGTYQSPSTFQDGSRVQSADDWQRRRREIVQHWQQAMGPWPGLIETPRVIAGPITRRENITQRQLQLEIGLGGQMVDAFLLVPDGDGPFPAVLDVYYDAQTGIGKGTPLRDHAWQLAKRGFVTLSIGKPNTGVDLENADQIPSRGLPYFGPVDKPLEVQPLSALAYAAANAHTFFIQAPRSLSGSHWHRGAFLRRQVGVAGSVSARTIFLCRVVRPRNRLR